MIATCGEDLFEGQNKLEDLGEHKLFLVCVAICYVSTFKHTLMRIYVQFRTFHHIFVFSIFVQPGKEHSGEVSVRVDPEGNPTRRMEVKLQSWGPAYMNIEYMHKIRILRTLTCDRYCSVPSSLHRRARCP